MADDEHSPQPPSDAQASNGSSTGIPSAPEGTPLFSSESADEGGLRPLDDLPREDFWEAIYGRRSIRKFRMDGVPRELIDQVMHAGIWAPSSCNYQMWDLVAVDDADVNRRLGELSLQMSNAPVNIIVSYGRNFSEENWANVQSASALIQNMSLAAHVLGLGTFWITQMGDREALREIVGLPKDRLVIAVLALGFPKVQPKKGPKRRPLSQVTHYNHYAGKPIPASADPNDWEPDLLAIYQRARVLNGLRHNKPRSWEQRALVTALDRLLPDVPAGARWLDVLPCTGILTEKLSRLRPKVQFDVLERSADVATFVAGRTRPKAGCFVWGDAATPDADCYDVITCLFRLEDATTNERKELLAKMAQWIKPEGTILVGYVSGRSFHGLTERMRARRGGPGGVEYVLSPDPNIGPFEPLDPRLFAREAAAAGLQQTARLGLQAVPQPEEIEFRGRNFSSRNRALARLVGKLLGWGEKLPGLQRRYGRFQFELLGRRG